MITQIAALALASAGNLPAAPDQPSTGTRVPQPEVPITEPLQQDAASQVRERFATCVYQRRPAQVDALLAASDTNNVDYEAAGIGRRRLNWALAMDYCLGRATSVTDSDLKMILSFPSLRAMMLEHSYRAHNPSGPAWVRSPTVQPVRRFVSTGDDLLRAQASGSFADCVVASVPREADALIRTPVNSKAEQAALRPLIPHLAPCIGNGVQVSLQAAQLRALLADGLWTAWRASTTGPLAPAGGK
jgi:hypothetical protein